MPEHGYAVKELDEIFDFSISTNSALTKSFVNSNKGTVPVYGASQNVDVPSYGYIKDNIEGIKYFDDCLTYNKDGASGMTFYRKGHFTISEKVVPLVIFEKYKGLLDYNYLKYAIEFEARKQQYTFSNKATKITFKKLKIKIPFNYNQEFDIIKQRQLAQLYAEIEEKRKALIDKLNDIQCASVRIMDDSVLSWKNVLCKDIFMPSNGNSIYTKEYIKSHSGTIPLYSGNTFGEFDMVDTADYDGEYLTWAKDGLAGYIMYHNGKFSLTGHRGILIPNPSFENIDLIDLKYIAYVLEPIFRSSIKGRRGDKGKNEYTTLNKAMIMKIKEPIPIPVDANNNYDLEKQNELVKKYDQIEEIKKQLFDKITELTSIVVA